MLLFTALLLFGADRAKNTTQNVGYSQSIIIGVAQGIAMVPGISRSGATIATAVLLKVDKSKAARFSFLMVIPLILGKVTKDFLSGDMIMESQDAIPLAVGFMAAFVSGLLACTWMLALVKNSKLYYFAAYCALVGMIAIAITLI